LKSKNNLLFTRRIVPAAIALCGVFLFTNALDSADRAFRSCPPGPSQQFALGLLFASGTGAVFSLMLALLFAVLAILQLGRDRKSGQVES
jgi:hypothetical protein